MFEIKKILKNLIIIILFTFNCDILFSQINFKAVESYYIDDTKTILPDRSVDIISSLPDLFRFFIKVEIINNTNHDFFIYSENSKFILLGDTIQLLVYTNEMKLITDKYLVPKGKSYIFIYSQFEKYEIPINECRIFNPHFFDLLKIRKIFNNETQFYIANSEKNPSKVNNLNFKIILSKKSKVHFFDKYYKHIILIEFEEYKNGIRNYDKLLIDELQKDIKINPIDEIIE